MSYRIPLNAPQPASDPTEETLGKFDWDERQITPSHDKVAALKKRYAMTFGKGVDSRPFDDEDDFRTDHFEMLMALVKSDNFRFRTERPLDQLGPIGSNPRQRWLDSPMHLRYINEVVTPKPGCKATTDMLKMDIIFWEQTEGLVGILAEFKFLRMPKAYRPKPFNAVWRECFYQAAWYLAGANYMAGTRLGLAVVNSRFIRLHMDNNVLSVEVHDNVTDRERGAVTNIQELEDASFIWKHGAPHDFFDPSTNEFIESEFNLYCDTYVQGAMLAANMAAALKNQPGAHRWDQPSHTTDHVSTSIAYDIDEQVAAANLKKNKWRRPSESARKKPQPKQPKQTKHGGPPGGAGGAGNGRAKPYSAPASHQQTAAASSTSTRQTRSQTKAASGGKKKRNRVLNVVFPWRWFRRDDSDRGGPPASVVRQVLANYRIRLVTSNEMTKLIEASKAELAHKAGKPSGIAARKRAPQQTTIRPPPRTPTGRLPSPPCAYPTRPAWSPVAQHDQYPHHAGRAGGMAR